MTIVLAPSANKRDLGEENIVHAFQNPIKVFPMDEGLVMVIGGDLAGNLLEVGYIASETNDYVIVHAMPARKKFTSDPERNR